MDINNITNEYLTNPSVIDNYTKNNFSDYTDYQKGLFSTYVDFALLNRSNKNASLCYATPLNNICFAESFSIGTNSDITGNFKEAAHYIISSLQTESNKFLFSKDNIVSLFKSNVGITELPMPLILYLGALYHFHSDETNNRLFGKNIYNLNYELDQVLNINLNLNSNTSPIYGTIIYGTNQHLSPSIVNFASVPVINDVFASGTNNTFIPKFGYGTFSNFMKDYYNFMIDKNGVNNQIGATEGYFSDAIYYTNTLFHHYGAENGFVKSFKSYNDGINFMGHYSIIKDSLGSSTLTTSNNIINYFKQVKNITFDKNDQFMYKFYMCLCRMKYSYLRGGLEKADILSILTQMNTLMLDMSISFVGNTPFIKILKFTAKKNAQSKTQDISPISYFIYKILFGRFFGEESVSKFGTSITYTLESVVYDDLTNDFGAIIGNGLFDNALLDSISVVTDFLLKFWDSEKTYKDTNEFDSNNVSGQLVVLLYPSAGGFFYPNNLLSQNTKNNNTEIITNITYSLSLLQKATFVSDGGGETDFFKLTSRNKNLNEYVPINYRTTLITPKDDLYKNQYIKLNESNSDIYDADNLYLFNKSGKIDSIIFDNRSVMMNTSRFLWYDTGMGGLQLGTNDYIDLIKTENDFIENKLTIKLSVSDISTNLMNNLYKNVDGYCDLNDKFTDPLRLRLYDLYDVIDIQKFKTFESIFLDFASSYKVYEPNSTQDYFKKYDGNYNFETLMKGIMTLDENDIQGYKTDQFELTQEDAQMLLVGYSSYNYYFCDYFYISAKINAVLTNAQYIRNKKVLEEFSAQKLPINNYSTVGSVAVPGQEDTIYTNYQNFIFRPDVIFKVSPSELTVSDSYAGEIYGIKPLSILTDENSNPDAGQVKYYTRKLVFGDYIIDPANNADTSIETANLVKKYFYDDAFKYYSDSVAAKAKKLYYGENNNYNFGVKYYNFLINEFFNYLNVKFDEDNLVLMFNLVTDYLKSIVNVWTHSDSFIVNDPFGVSVSNLHTTSNYNSSNDSYLWEIVGAGQYFEKNKNLLTKEITNYLTGFVSTFYYKNVKYINLYLDTIKNSINSNFLNSNAASSLLKQIQKENTIDELKSKTYYNVKNLFDKYIAFNNKSNKILEVPYDSINVLDELGKINNGLFYNYLFKDISVCDTTINSYTGENSVFDKDQSKHLIEYINIVDRSNKDIGSEILIDLIALSDSLQLKFSTTNNSDNDVINSEITNKAVFGLFSDIAQHNDFILHPVNTYVDYLSPITNVNNELANYANNIFGTHLDIDRIDSNPSFILQWINHTSSVDSKKLTSNSKPSYSGSFPLDLQPIKPYFNDNKNLVPDDVKTGNITSFIVDFGNKNQNMFSKVRLDTSEFSNTEESIKAAINLTNNGSETSQKVASGNLFSLMETRSYTCQVESMGNVMIQPLTYFYLKNVPLFYGSYWITNVEHNITANNMTTTFKGVRQPFNKKTTNKSDILNSLQLTLTGLTKTLAQNTSNNTTTGQIYNDRNNVGSGFGTFYQKSNANRTYVSFDGMQILYSWLVSHFSLTDEIYKIVLIMVYNRAKYFANGATANPDPSVIRKYMVDIVLQLKANWEGQETTYFFNPATDSLQDLLNAHKDDLSTNEIGKTITALGLANTNDDVLKLLTPSNKLKQQKLLVSDAASTYGSDLFDPNKKTTPKINFINNYTDAIDYSKSNIWQAYYMLYYKNVSQTASDTNNIYTIKVNNENSEEYVFLNVSSNNDLKFDTLAGANYRYLGCYDQKNGIVFYGINNNENNISYGKTIAPNMKELPPFAGVPQDTNVSDDKNSAILAYNFYIQNGFSKEAAASLVGNFSVESNFNPKIVTTYNKKLSYNDPNQTYAAGIVQWVGGYGRRSKVLIYAKSKGIEIPNFEQAAGTYSNWNPNKDKFWLDLLSRCGVSKLVEIPKTENTQNLITAAFSNMTLQVQLEYTLLELPSYQNFNTFKTSTDINYTNDWVFRIYEGSPQSGWAKKAKYAANILNTNTNIA